MPIPIEAIPAVKKVVTVVGPVAVKQIMKFWSENHGSKVKEGDFKDCKIGLFGDQACIVTDAASGGVILLTSETIQSYQYVKEKRRPPKMHTYFYYKIFFNDGSKSYVRMRRKYRDAMMKYL